MNFQKTKEWVFKHKIISTVIFLIVLGLVGIITTPAPAKTTVAENNSQIATSTETKVVEKTPEQKVSEAITNSLVEKTNMGKPRIISVELDDISGGEKQAFIKVNASKNLIGNLQKATLSKEAMKINQAVFPVDSSITELVIWSYLPTTDKYGNVKDDVVVIYSSSKDLFNKVNWATFDYHTLPDLLKSENKTDDRNNYVEKVRIQ